ncbi:MAG: hypothetical protein HY321_20860 [Armatimonadetes bacterium]|nr:hypothetical protein [Armatimonadota bacterium]
MRILHLVGRALPLLGALTLTRGSPVLADATPLEAVGRTLQPRATTEVRLVREVVEADIGARLHVVSADFWLRNEGPATSLDVGFPLDPDQPPQHLRAYLVDETGSPGGEFAVTIRPAWFTWRVRFAAGEDVHLRVTYDQVRPDKPWCSHLFRYILRTGAAWKGPIGHATIRVRLPGHHHCRPIWAVPAGYRFDGSIVSWELSDFEPDFDVALRWEGPNPAWAYPILYTTQRALPDSLGDPFPKELRALATPVPEALVVERRGDRAVLRQGKTTLEVRANERRAVLNRKVLEMPAPARFDCDGVDLPVGILHDLGWVQARYLPGIEVLVVSSRGINLDAAADGGLTRFHRTPRLETPAEYRTRIAELERSGAETPEGRFELAELRYYSGDVDGARESYARCADEADGGEPAARARFWEAQCLAHRDGYAAAVAALENAFAAPDPDLADAARLQAAAWLIEYPDRYALPDGQDRFARARELAGAVWKKDSPADTVVQAGLLLFRCEEAAGSAERAEEAFRACVRRFPNHDGPAHLLKDRQRVLYSASETRRREALRLLVKCLPGRPETRAALLDHLRRGNLIRNDGRYPRAWERDAALPRVWVRIVLAATRGSDADSRWFREWGALWLAGKLTPEDDLTEYVRSARAWRSQLADPDAFWRAESRQDRLFADILARGDLPAARRLVALAGPGAWSWREQLAAAEGRPDESLALLQQMLHSYQPIDADDWQSIQERHARVVEVLAQAGRVSEALQWFGELHAHARATERRHEAYSFPSAIYRAGGRALLAEDPGSPRGQVMAVLAGLPSYYGGPGADLDGMAARLERLAARYPDEPLAWAGLARTYGGLRYRDHFEYRAIRGRLDNGSLAAEAMQAAEREVVTRNERWLRRMDQCVHRALALEPGCPEVAALIRHPGMVEPGEGRMVIGWLEECLRGCPEDARFRYHLALYYEREGGDPARARAHREVLLKTLRAALDSGVSVLCPEEDDLWLLAEQYKALGREPDLEIVRERMRRVPPKEPETPAEIARAIAWRELSVFYPDPSWTANGMGRPGDFFLQLGQLYERAGRRRDAARAYRLGLVCGKGKREELEAALRALEAGDAHDGPNGTPGRSL